MFLWSAMPALAQEDTPAQEAVATLPGGLLGPEQLRRVVAPVAFYSDDLLAIVLPASTNPLQIVEAQRFLVKRKKNQKLQPNAEWDPAVLALINYPEVIEKMNAELEWTKVLGNAVIDQLQDVMDMIQQLRAEAASSGYLQSNEIQVVYWDDGNWLIDPYDPDYIYIPDYPPDHPIFNPPSGVRPEHPIVLPPGTIAPRPEHPIAYPPPPYVSHHAYWSPGATFFAGAFLGAAFGYGFDWNNSEIDINVGNDCCRGGNIDSGGGDRVDDRTGDRFNADRQWVGGRDKMTWSPNKARQKQAVGNQGARRNKAAALPAQKRGTGAATKLTNPALQNPYRPGNDRRAIEGKNSALGNYQSGRDAGIAGNRGHRSLDDSRSNRSGSSYSDQRRSRSSASAFGGYNRGSTVRMQSSRGSRSMGSRGSRGGGRR